MELLGTFENVWDFHTNHLIGTVQVGQMLVVNDKGQTHNKAIIADEPYLLLRVHLRKFIVMLCASESVDYGLMSTRNFGDFGRSLRRQKFRSKNWVALLTHKASE